MMENNFLQHIRNWTQYLLSSKVKYCWKICCPDAVNRFNVSVFVVGGENGILIFP